MTIRKLYYILPFLFLTTVAFSQSTKEDIIQLTNPSFEDKPNPGVTPSGWNNCGPISESPPDIQPNGGFNVTKKAHHGMTYMGLVARDNNTWESVSQRLKQPMKAKQCYKMSLHLAHSPIYKSQTKKSRIPVNFDKGVTVRIWGGNSYKTKK